MTDASTTSRVLRVLSLLQARQSWTGAELSERVGVTDRTMRRDIDRLRELGYRIASDRGALGGYRLEAGHGLPPLLFTDDEAIALALGVTAGLADAGVQGVSDLAVSVLAKVEQVLPAAVRSRVRAIQGAVSSPEPVRLADSVEPEVIATLALACRDSEIVRFSYQAADGAVSSRRAEAVALVPVGRRWYLLAWDTDRQDWRTFRLDRITDPSHTRVIAPQRAVPGGAAAFVLERFSLPDDKEIEATVRIAANLDEVESYLGAHTTGLSADGDSTLWHLRAERVELLFGALAWICWPFEISEGAELAAFANTFETRRSAGRR